MLQKSLLHIVALCGVFAEIHEQDQTGDIKRHVFFHSNASVFRYVGRFDRGADIDGNRVMNFDMNGCEIQFRVEGAREVFMHLEQQISGPGGWYLNHTRAATSWAKHFRKIGAVSNTGDGPVSLLQSAAESSTLAASQEMAAIQTSMQPSGSEPHEFLVYVDGVPQTPSLDGSHCRGCTFDTRLAQKGKVQKHLIARDLSAGPHEIRVFKISDPEWSSRQPTPNWLSFHGLSVDAGEVKAPATPRRKRRIEILGDSIASGYCNLCRNGEDVVERQGSFAASWATKTCDTLDAECHSLAMAGFGIAQNCCGDNGVRMPDLFYRGVATDSDSHWDFASWVPDVLIIHLGANDHLWEPTVDPENFRREYVDLVVAVGNTYGPDVKVFLGCGPTEASTKACPHVQFVVEKAKEAGVDAHFLDHRGYFNSGHHCCFHPSAEQSDKMARDTAALISKVAGWA